MNRIEKLDLTYLRKYSKSGPRYTSYPTAPVFDDSFGETDYIELLSERSRSEVPLSLYFHIPFCKSVCYFCACNVIYTRNRSHIDPYTEQVLKEMDLLLAPGRLSPERPVSQLHWGGGTPTFLTPDRIVSFWGEIKKRFSFRDDAEISIELDPREVTDEHIDALRRSGFNRASLGIQDVDEQVQHAVNRVQPIERSIEIYQALRRFGFEGINFDLIYGLPLQSVDSFAATLNQVTELRPDRISLFNFAFLPHLKTHQKRIDPETLPSTEERLAIFAAAVQHFAEAGYEYIGMDHFALPEDELTRSQHDGTLHRNFQGYTTRGGTDLIGIGVTSIGELSDGYAQNARDTQGYYAALDSGQLPVIRGLRRNDDDRLRHRVIMQLICNFSLDFATIDREFSISFADYFAAELKALGEFVDDGLVTIDSRSITIEWQGRFVIRNICMVFDSYLDELEKRGQKFSKTV